MITLLCTVRGCGLALECDDRGCRCANGHSFDRARSGYINLLQPQDRRSRNPGDSREAVQARRRLADRGVGEGLTEHLGELLTPLVGSSGCSILDVGCGEGSHLIGLSERFLCEAAGLDISTPAIDLAARRNQSIVWIVANADRLLPFDDQQFDLVLSITSRRNAAEFARVLEPGGRAVIVVPGESDLIELREAVLGSGVERSRMERVIADLGVGFELERRSEVKYRLELRREDLLDLLRSTYRGSRRTESEKAESLDEMTVTFHLDVMMFRRR